MGSPLYYFKFNVKDWLADSKVRGMTPGQRGCYVDLLCFQWEEGAIPTDTRELARMVGVPHRDFIKSYWPKIAPRFTPIPSAIGQTDGMSDLQKNDRLEAERIKAMRLSHTNAENGVKGAESLALRSANADESPWRTPTSRRGESPANARDSRELIVERSEKDLPPGDAGGFELAEVKPAKVARKAKAKPAPNPLPFTAAQAVDFVAMAAGEHFTDTETPLPKNHVIPIQAHIRSFPDPKRWALAGEYLASGRAFMGEAAPSLLASSKLPELMAKSAAWERHGKPPDAKHPRRVDDNTGPSHAARRDSESVNRNLPTKEQMDADEPEVRRILADFHARNGTQ